MTYLEEILFKKSCNEPLGFPENLVYHNTYNHVLKAYVKRLDDEENRLFDVETEARVCLRDFDDTLKGLFQSTFSRK
jgi:hypothetical protein